MRDRPALVSLGLALLVTLHSIVSTVDKPFAVRSLAESLRTVKDVAALYLGGAVVATVAAGFAGVVVVFAMGQGLDRLATMRRTGGDRLEANWLSMITQAFSSAAFAVAAAFVVASGRPNVGGWLFELAIVSSLHSATRQLWLLRALIKAVRAGDRRAREQVLAKDVLQ